MKQLTVADLYALCGDLMRRNMGDKIVLVTDDEEGNGYHALWYDFTTDVRTIEETSRHISIDGEDPKKVVLLG